MGLRALGSLFAVLTLAFGLTACGDLGATEEELAQARKHGEKIGFTEGRKGFYQQINEASEESYREGRKEGQIEGHEDERFIEELTEEEFDSTPEKLDGTESYEFEPEDLERAEEAPSDVREYCEGAVSEAQELGCLSHVESSEVP